MKNNNDILFILKGIVLILLLIVIVLFLMLQSNPEKNKQKEVQLNSNKTEEITSKAQKQKTNIEAVVIKAEPKQELLSSEFPPFAKYRYLYKYTFTVNGQVTNFHFEVPVPNTEEGRQYITEYIISPKPTSLVYRDGSLIANYDIASISAGKFNIVIDGIAKVRTYNINTAKKINSNLSPEVDLSRYLKPEKHIESDDKYILGIAKGIQGNTQEEIIEKVYRYIQDHMKYRIERDVFGAKKALELGYGKCSEYSAIMTALLRAKGIPSRIVTGNIARDNNTPHNWVEVYYKDYGWVTYDPTFEPTRVSIFGPNGRLNRVEKRYDVSHDNIQYIQSGLNLFSPYKMRYNTSSQKSGIINMQESLSIQKV